MAVKLNRPRSQKQQPGQKQKNPRPVNGGGQTRNTGKSQNQNPPIEWPASPAEFLATDFDRLLAAQVTRFIVGNQLGPVGIGLRPGRGVSLDGLYAFQTTTSFSRHTP